MWSKQKLVRATFFHYHQQLLTKYFWMLSAHREAFLVRCDGCNASINRRYDQPQVHCAGHCYYTNRMPVQRTRSFGLKVCWNHRPCLHRARMHPIYSTRKFHLFTVWFILILINLYLEPTSILVRHVATCLHRVFESCRIFLTFCNICTKSGI